MIMDYYKIIFDGLKKEFSRMDYFIQTFEKEKFDFESSTFFTQDYTADEFFHECRKVIAEYKLNIELQHESNLLGKKMIYHKLRLAYESEHNTGKKEAIKEHIEEMKDKIAKLEEKGWQNSGWCHRLSDTWRCCLYDEWHNRQRNMLNYNLSSELRTNSKNITDGKRIFYLQIIELEEAINETERAVMNKSSLSSSVGLNKQEDKTDNQTTEKIINETESSTQDKQITFADLLRHDNKDVLLKELHELIDGKDKKDVAITIQALKNLSILVNYGSKEQLYVAMRKEFEIKGSKLNSAFNQFLNPDNNKILERDTKPIERRLSAIK
jgi:hypothetical protein